MARLRSLSFPRLSLSKHNFDAGEDLAHPQAHSRDSSGASSLSMPNTPTTPTFFNRPHNRWPSSTYSLAITPESLTNVAKSPLDDLLEDPAERDSHNDLTDCSIQDEPLCICDMTFCEHRRASNQYRPSAVLPPTPDNEWASADAYFSDDVSSDQSSKRRDSGEHNATDSLTTRLSRRFPSISRRWRDSTDRSVGINAFLHSAPPSRSSSVNKQTSSSTARRSFMAQIELPSSPITPFSTPADNRSEESVVVRPRASSKTNPKGLEIVLPEQPEDLIDRHDRVSTPLLPPIVDEHRQSLSEDLQSPLQSPSFADPGSLMGTPTSTPVLSGCMTPPLSAIPSTTSVNPTRPGNALSHSIDASSTSLNKEIDPWAYRLGHANFYIYPEPYMPAHCDSTTCRKLLEDWEAARREYMRQAVRVGELHGPMSQIYKLTEQKWEEIDARWRELHEHANATAKASGEQANSQTLAKTQRGLSRMPSLNDPEQPYKFPRIDDADIVGPMVKYAEVQRRPSKKKTLLRIFTDPALLLGPRSTITGFKRRF